MSGPPSAPEIDEATRRRLSPAVLKATSRIGRSWGLRPCDVADLLGMSADEYDRAIQDADLVVLTPSQFDGAGLPISIFGALGELFDPTAAHSRPRRPNAAPPFGGRSALETMRAGGTESMTGVLRYLRAIGQGL